MDVNQPDASRSVLPTVSLVVTAASLVASLFAPVLILGLGLISAGLGFFAYRQTRNRSTRDRTLGQWALIAAIVPLAFGVMWFGTALLVSGTAVFAD